MSDRAHDLVEACLAEAMSRPGVHDAQVRVVHRSATNLRWAMTELTGNGTARSSAVAVAVGVALPSGGLGVGVVERTGVGSADVPALVDDAVAAARRSGPAEDDTPLPDPSQTVPASADWEQAAPEAGPEVLSRLTADLGQVVANARAQEREAFGFARHEQRTVWLGTSAGATLRHVGRRGAVEVTSMSHGRSRSAWAGRGTVDFADVDLVALDAEVATRLAWQARRVDLPAGRRTVVLPPDAVADLVIYLHFSSDARSAHQGRSVFSADGGRTRIGERLTPAPVRLSSDPAHPGLESTGFVVATDADPFISLRDNGLPITRQDWISDGVLTALPTTRHTASLTGLPRAQAGGNLLMEVTGGAGDTGDLLSGVADGLLLTCLWYIREVDAQTLLLTGLTRDGVYQVRDGEVVAAVNNFRFNESPVAMLSRISAAGATRGALSREWNEYMDRTAMPALVVDDFNLSSVSEAS